MKRVMICILGLAMAMTATTAPKAPKTSNTTNTQLELSKELDVYNALMKELVLYYVDTVNIKTAVENSIEGMLDELDPYTTYVREEDEESFKFMTTGHYGGIGALISQRVTRDGKFTYDVDGKNKEHKIIVSEPYLGMPADKNGLKAGDEIVMIGKESVKGKTVSDVSEILRGVPGTEIEIVVKRGDRQIKRKIVREQIAIPAVTYHGMLNDSIGYVLLSQFIEGASEEVKQALTELMNGERGRLKGVILDLRGNPGGLLDEAVKVVNIFVGAGEKVLDMKGRVKAWDQSYTTENQPMLPQIPLAVLINEGSASASEIVSGALQDMDRATIIGTRSYGKGLVQGTRELPYGGKLKLTIGKYYTPSGRCIQAIDYSKRDAEGLIRTPDSLRKEFKTRKGRVVKDGGGIEPDIEVKNTQDLNLSVQLERSNLIFDYVTELMRNEESGKRKEVTGDTLVGRILKRSEYDDFKEMVKGSDFKYKLQTAKALDKLEEMAKAEGYGERSKVAFEELKKKLEADMDTDLENMRNDIVDLIEREITVRRNYKKGLVKWTIEDDPVVKKAKEKLMTDN